MIVVGVDSSTAATIALRWAVDEARVRGTAVRAVHAFQTPFQTGRNYIPPELLDPARLRAQALALAADAAEPVVRDNPDIAIDLVAHEGLPAQTLCEAARDADLLVVGARSRRHLHTGSVGRHCSSHASCPVVIVAPSKQS